jgi:hypothetical protein
MKAYLDFHGLPRSDRLPGLLQETWLKRLGLSICSRLRWQLWPPGALQHRKKTQHVEIDLDEPYDIPWSYLILFIYDIFLYTHNTYMYTCMLYAYIGTAFSVYIYKELHRLLSAYVDNLHR